MSTIYDVKASDLVGSTAEKLKGLISKPPEYISVAKSSSNRDRPPSSPDFWYVRSASILRQVYLNSIFG
ncbi:MAG: 40S ribosomal protein S19, partial [Candidatus Marsarchaeota archaeon]|nr:40S ribosomal protein S19 [Candidatus Marsarchaeota archaeon]